MALASAAADQANPAREISFVRSRFKEVLSDARLLLVAATRKPAVGLDWTCVAVSFLLPLVG